MKTSKIFSAKRLDAFERLLEKKGIAAKQVGIPQRSGDRSRAPLSFAQQRIWFFDQMEPGSAAYNIPFALRLSGSLDVPALEQSLNEIVQRHESLRTTFQMMDLQPMQFIAPHATFSLSLVDLQNLPEKERESTTLRLTAEEARLPFNLETGPLLRGKLLRLGAEDHILLLTMHHIISDGWSISPLTQEVVLLYAAFSQGQPHVPDGGSPLPKLPIQYADFAVWQREWLQGENYKTQVAYWKQQLAATSRLELPTDRPRPPVQTFRGTDLFFNIAPALTAQLQAFSQQEGGTLFMTLLAAFNVLLHRYTGQEDIVVGSPIAGRNQPEVGGLIGFFVNTLALRTNLSGNPAFRELMHGVSQTCLAAYAHQDVQFEQLVEELRPERDLSRSPLFQVMFQLRDKLPENVVLPGLTLSLLPTGTQTAMFDLSFSLSKIENGLTGAIEYNTDLFDRETIQRMAGHFQVLLEGIITDPDQRIADLPLLTEAERQQILVEWDATTPLPSPHFPLNFAEHGGSEGGCIHELFEAQAGKTPEAVALTFDPTGAGDQQFTYRQLNARANQLAHYLRKQGVGPDVLVGICMERSPEMIVGLLGILKAGGAYVPLDPEYPKERLGFMLADSRATVLLTQTHLQDNLPPSQARMICLDRDWPRIASESKADCSSGVTGENPAYIIYTSGSTGRPKGVIMCHQPLVNLMNWQLSNSTVARAKTLQFTSLSFDVSCQEMFATWSAGGTLVLVSETLRRDSYSLLDFIAAQGVERIFLPFVALQHLAEVAQDATQTSVHLREIITAGEALRITPPIANWLNKLKGCVLYNQYGPSETHVVTAFTLQGQPETWDVFPPIGRPISNTQIYLLDARLQPAPIGVPGELYIGGAGLARGYLNRPELTAEKFIPNPFSPPPSVKSPMGGAGGGGGDRLYKTGDLARYLADGNIEFLGRMDHQVKVRGFRIELGEIEAVLSRHPSVRDAVVVVREDSPGNPQAGAGKRLVAYVVAEQALSVEELRSHLKTRLPEYMLPTDFVFLDQLPLTPTGKVDRKALPAPSGERPELAHEYRAPRTRVEHTLADIWKEILRVERVGIHDNFFELGGHSLLATQVISRIRKAFNSELPLRTLFEAPSVAELAQSIKSAQHLDAPALLSVARPEKLPLSFAQQRLWFIDQLEPGNTAYNIFNAIRLRGALDVSALERGFQQIVQRHESLRTTFQSVEGEPHQVIAADMPVSLPLTDLSALSRAEQETEAQRLALDEARRPFDLSSGPLVRCTLLRMADDPATGASEHILLLTMHHIISDGWSISVLFREAIVLSQAYAAGQDNPLPALSFQYADFAIWQRNWLQGEVLERQLSYWKKQLADAPAALELPADHPRPAVQTYHGKCMNVALSRELSDALQSLNRQEDATLFMTLLAAFQVLLSRYSGQTDIVVGSPVANRNRSETEGLIGFFVNTLALRADLSGNPSFREALKRVRETCLDAYDHQDVPFEKLVDEVQVRRDMSRNPLFQAMFVLQNTPGWGISLPGLTLSPLPIENGTAKFDLILSLTETGQGLAGTLEYNTDLFDRETIVRMAGHFQTLLEGIVVHPDQRLSDLPLLTEAERQQILVEWNATTPLPSPHFPLNFAEHGGSEGGCIHQLFEAQAGKTPEAVALTFEGQQLTYRELNGRANQLAHSLQKQGVGPDVLVGICVEHSLEMVIGALGILKAGGAYVPLDPGYPRDRLAYMLEDSGISVLLTQERILESFPEHAVQVVCLDRDWEVLMADQSIANPISSVRPENLAYVIYTSGSTGKPKGVGVTHANVGRLFDATQAWYRFSNEDAWSLFHSFAFDFSVWEIWGALLYGGRLVIVPYLVSRSPEEFYRLLVREQVTVLNQTPSAFKQLIGVEEATGMSPELKLRLVIFGGEALEIRSLRSWFELHGDQHPQLVNMYGITETTVHVTYRPIKHSDLETTFGSMVGQPIPDLKVYLLDQSQNLVPVGVSGEIYVGGNGLARGYLNRPDLTAEKFVPNPFASPSPPPLGTSPMGGEIGGGPRLYRSGDSARYLPNGDIEYLGRIDHQVKIRGFRIELGEIEAALRQHPAVREALALARDIVQDRLEDQPGDPLPGTGKRLVAYVVAEQTLSVEELRSHLKTRLPEYMLPSAFVFLDQLPLTPNGKVDRKALPAPSGERPELAHEYVAPRTPAEQILVDIWKKILEVDEIGVHDDFFESGGDSILSLRVIAFAKQAGLNLKPRQIFEHPTIAGLAALGEDTSGQVGQEMVTGAAPLLPGEDWFFRNAFPDPHWWNITRAFKLNPEMANPVFWEQALRQVLLRHDALRTRFVQKRSNWQQGIAAPNDGAVPFACFNLSDLPAQAQDVKLTAIAAELQKSMDLAHGPILRLALFDFGAHKPPHLLLVVHHLVSDDISMQILVEDIVTAYQQVSRSEAVRLPPKTTSVQEWGKRLQVYACSEGFQRQVDDWLALPWQRVAPLPVDYPDGREKRTADSIAAVWVSLSAQESQVLLKALPRLHNAQVFDALLTALAHSLARWTGAPWVAINTIDSGRTMDIPGAEDADLSRTVGWLATGNCLLLESRDTGDPLAALQSIREQVARFPKYGIPIQVANLSSPQHVKSRFPEYATQIMLNYTGQNVGAAAQADVMKDAVVSAGPEKNPACNEIALLACSASVWGGRLFFTWRYSKNVHKETTVKQVAGDFVQALKALAAHCDEVVGHR
jgi:amino acid adenylation domain-containing protein/non-ribosomal peptide synthase protein (TIGR01720 family)